jgi:hypothetical protein
MKTVPLLRLLLLAAAAPALCVPAWAESGLQGVLQNNPFKPKSDKKAAPPSAARTVPWSDAKIAEAKAKCDELLADITLEYEPQPPIKEGVCGAPAPILVKSIGSDPKVVIAPAAKINCAVAAALYKWLKEEVQPEAIATFGAPVVKLRNAASYACRNRNNAERGILSEHALANALDIAEFTLESGHTIAVLTAWPRVVAPDMPPIPEPNPLRADATAAVDTEPPPLLPVAPKPRPARVSHLTVFGNVTEAAKINPFVLPTPMPMPPPTPTPISATPPLLEEAVASVPLPSPKPEPEREAKPVRTPQAYQKSAFVRSIYAKACKTFGTTLGPSADAAHRNHFHFDMKYRRGGYCR